VNRLLAPKGVVNVSLNPGYLCGCMYEITARCRHRFTRFQA
jgi:hypothetical protein